MRRRRKRRRKAGWCAEPEAEESSLWPVKTLCRSRQVTKAQVPPVALKSRVVVSSLNALIGAKEGSSKRGMSSSERLTLDKATCSPISNKLSNATSLGLITVILWLSLMPQTTICDLLLPQAASHLNPLVRLASERKPTVISELPIGGSGGQPEQRRQQQQQLNGAGKFGVNAQSTSAGAGSADIEPTPRLIVQRGQEAALGCHILGRPLEPSGKLIVRRRDANGMGNKTGNDDYGDGDDESSAMYGHRPASIGSGSEQDQLMELNENDLVSLMFWYKDDNPAPIYTLDARQVAVPATDTFVGPATKSSHHQHQHHHHGGNGHQTNQPLAASGQERFIQNNRQLLAQARHYPSISADATSSRLRLDSSSHFPKISLLIGNTIGQDSGQYKCRIDFRRSRTISQVVELLVEVPISRLEISIGQPGEVAGVPLKTASKKTNKPEAEDDEEPVASGSKLAEHQPPAALVVLSEGQETQFTCLAFDGSPPPTISWLVRWPASLGAANSSQVEQPPTELLLSTDRSLTKYGARLEPSPMSRDQCLDSWLTTEASSSSAVDSKPETLMAGSRLVVAPLIRPLHGAMIGCRASQQVTPDGGAIGINAAAAADTVANYQRQLAPSSITTNDHRVGPRRHHGHQQDAGKGKTGGSKMIDAPEQQPPSNYGPSSAYTTSTKNLQLTEWFELKLRLGPQVIEILSEQVQPEAGGLWVAQLEEGQRAKFLCSSRGSEPPARLRWSWLMSEASVGGYDYGWQESSLDGGGGDSRSPWASTLGDASSSGSSLFELSPVGRHHHLAKLVCTATNEELESNRADRSLTAQIKLLVRFKPAVKLLELSEEPSTTKTIPLQMEPPSSRRLKCSVQSNPPINQLVWLVNERPIARVTAPEREQWQPAGSKLPQQTSSSPSDTTSHSSTMRATTTAAASAPPVSVKRSSPKSKNRSVVGGGDGGQFQPITGEITNDEDDNNEDGAPIVSTNGTDIAEYNNHELLDWSLSPLVPSAIDGSKYLVEGNLLTLMNLINLDQKDEYKCLAINALGQGSSKKFRLNVNYKPLCLSKHNKGGKKAEGTANSPGLDATLGLGLEADQIWQIGATLDTGSVRCQVEAQPPPIKFAWSFVSLGELVKLVADRQNNLEPPASDDVLDASLQLLAQQLNQSASLSLETDGPELSYQELLAWTSAGDGTGRPRTSQQHGLLLCRALNPVGWQPRPCVNLVLTPELLEPSAGNCTVEPLMEGRPTTSGDRASSSGQQQQQHIAISVDCSRAQNKERLLFQLAITRRDTSNVDRWQETAASAGHQPTTWRNKRLLFTEPADGSHSKTAGGGQPTRIPMSALLADLDEEPPSTHTTILTPDPSQQQPELEAQSDQSTSSGGGDDDELRHEQRKSRRGPIGGGQPHQARVMTLSEQVELLNELVFSISASNLMQTSEPHAILGSQLRLPEVASLQQQEERPPLAQVSRSASHADSANEEGQTPVSAVTTIVVNNQNSIKSPNGGASTRSVAPSGRQQSELAYTNWSSATHLEVNITLAAIGGTIILSALTLTLIILMLRGHRNANGTTKGGGGSGFSWCKGRKRSRKGQEETRANGSDGGQLPLATSRPGSAGSSGRWQVVGDSSVRLGPPGTRVDFLAPPVRSSLKRPAAVEGGKSLVLTMDSSSLCRQSVSHLSLNQYPEHQTTEPQTLYVIGTATAAAATDGSFELADQEQSGVDVSFSDEPCASVSHLCEPADNKHHHGRHQHHHHHLLSNNGQQLQLSYCSPSICNSSSHQESLNTTNNTITTSDIQQQQFLITQPAGANRMAAGSIVNCCSLTTNDSPECQLISDDNQEDDGEMEHPGTTNGLVCATNTTTPVVCSNVDSMYLFSFL